MTAPSSHATATPPSANHAHRRHTIRRTVSRLRGAARDESGSVAAEVAIAVPVLVAVLVFAGVLVARGVDARLRLDDVAHQAARAASLTRTAAQAQAAAQQTATASLSSAGVDCTDPAVSVDTSDFQPGGTVTVTVSCRLDLSDAAALLAIGSSRTLTASASSPIDTYRAAYP
jgi:Flp pilus assembly protein TadG